MRIANQMDYLHAELSKSATVIQSWQRSVTVHRKFAAEIKLRIGLARKRHKQELETALRIIVRLQRSVRANLARKKVAEVRLVRQQTTGICICSEEDVEPKQ